jgi:predicted branched-subunit amino acid permease
VNAANSSDQSPDTARDAFRTGFFECVMLVPSYIPFALVCGVAAVQAGMGQLGAVALAAFAFAGSSQAVLTQFVARGEALARAALSGVYSAAIAPRLANTTRKERMLWAAFLVDQTFLSNESRHQRGAFAAHPLAFYLGCAAAIWPPWVIANAVGAFVGAKLPSSWQLEFTIPLSFIALMVPFLKSRAHVASALAGGAAGVLLFALPLKLGLIAACLIGACVGLLVDTLLSASGSQQKAGER